MYVYTAMLWNFRLPKTQMGELQLYVTGPRTARLKEWLR